MMRINLKLVSILLSILLWFYVNIFVSPITKRTFIEPIEIRNAPTLTKVELQTTKATVTLEGTRRDFIFAGPNPVKPYVDLLNARPGSIQVPVKVIFQPRLSIVSIKPEQVIVEIEQLQRKEVNIIAEVIGSPADGFIAEPPTLSRKTVTVEGLPEVVEKITHAKVFANIQNIKNSYSESLGIILYGKTGDIKDEVKVIPDRITVDILVKEGFPEKKVLIATPTILNPPPQGYKLTYLDFTPKETIISAPSRFLNQIEIIEPTPIDLSNITASSEIIALLKPPYENVSFKSAKSIKVLVDVEKIPITKNFNNLIINVKHSSNQNFKLYPATFSLTLQGFISEIESIDQKELYSEIDISKYEYGTHTIKIPTPQNINNSNIKIIEIFPKQIQVYITPLSSDPNIISSETNSINWINHDKIDNNN